MIGYSGLTAAQASQNTTANNIAKINTNGYSRQQLKQEAAQALRTYTHYGMAGSGVDAVSIDQVRDAYIDLKYRANATSLGEYTRKNSYMMELENYFVDTDLVPGFNTVYVDEFYNQLAKLADDPGSTTTRQAFIGKAQSVVEYFNNMSINLEKTQETLNSEIKDVAERINGIAAQVASLNKQINMIEMNGTIANELRDQRELLIDELSTYVDVETREVDIYNYGDPDNPTGLKNYQVMIGGASTLVDGYEYDTLECRARDEKINQSDIDGLYDIYWKKNCGKFAPLSPVLSGQLKGLIQLRDGNNKEFFDGNLNAHFNATEKTIKVTVPPLSTVKGTVAADAAVGGDSVKIKTPDNISIPNSGTIVIGGKSYSYSGRSGGEFTGLSPVLAEAVTEGTIISTSGRNRNDTNLLDMNKCTLPDSGTINVSGFDYLYSTWSYKDNGDGTGEYTFNNLKYRDANNEMQDGLLDGVDKDMTVRVGQSIDYQGIPYYQSQLNEFVRCLASAFNNIESKGTDLFGTEMGDRCFFRLVDIDGTQHDLMQTLDPRGTVPGTGTQVIASNDSMMFSYNNLTAKNFVVNEDILADCRNMATTYNTEADSSLDGADLVKDLYSLKTDKDKIIFRGCSSAEFLQCVLSDVALGKQSANTFEKNFTIIGQAITNQRLSVSGVDTDEEALNLVKFQHAYELSAKVIQTMTEMYDRLILNTGV